MGMRTVIAVVAVIMIAGCNSGMNEAATELHSKLIKSGKLQVVTSNGISMESVISPSGGSAISGDERQSEQNETTVEPVAIEGSVTVDNAVKTPDISLSKTTPPVTDPYYITFNDNVFSIERGNNNVASGDWAPLNGSTLLVLVNNVESRMTVEVSGSTLTIVENTVNTPSNNETESGKKCYWRQKQKTWRDPNPIGTEVVCE